MEIAALAKRKSIRLLHITPDDELRQSIDAAVTEHDRLFVLLLYLIGLLVSVVTKLDESEQNGRGKPRFSALCKGRNLDPRFPHWRIRSSPSIITGNSRSESRARNADGTSRTSRWSWTRSVTPWRMKVVAESQSRESDTTVQGGTSGTHLPEGLDSLAPRRADVAECAFR